MVGDPRQLEPRDAGTALVLTLGSAGLETEVSCFAKSTQSHVMTLDAKVQGTGWHTVTHCCWEKLALSRTPVGEDNWQLCVWN